MIDKTVLAYIAGLFDGEGHISIPVKKRDGQKPQHFLQIGITNRKLHLLTYVQKALKMGHINIDERHYDTGKARTCYRWITNSKEAEQALKLLLPYLREKNQQAELAIELQSGIACRNFQVLPLSGIELNRRDRIKQEIETLNAA